MKMKDIVVGEDYAVGSERYNERATVVDKGNLERRVYSGRGHSHTSTGAGVRISKTRWGGKRAFEEIVPPNKIVRPWAEQERIKAEQRKVDQAIDQRNHRIDERAAQLNKRLRACDITGDNPYPSARRSTTGAITVSLSYTEAGALLDLLAKVPE